ncbi:MAG: STAS domain-containing protein [Acidimicrobiales bacterium]
MHDGAPAEPPRVPTRDVSDASDGESVESPGLRIDVRRDDHEAIVQLSGELDLSSAPQLRDFLVTLLSEDGPGRLVVDLSDLVYLDSTGLSVLVTAHKRAISSGTAFSLASPNSSVRRLLGITALDQIFDFVDSPGFAADPAPLKGTSVREGEAAEGDA